MLKALTAEQVQHFKEFGYVAPVRVMSVAQALELRERLEDFEHGNDKLRKKALNVKSHLLFSWLNDLVRKREVVDAIDDGQDRFHRLLRFR